MIDYIINKSCPVKTELSAEELIDLVKSRNRAAGFFQMLRQEGKSDADALDTSFTIQMVGPDGQSRSNRVSVRDLFQESSQLKELAPHCQDCPLNVNSEAFGCYNSVTYPITAEAERWLAELAARAAERGLPHSILLKFIVDENVPGEFFGAMRKAEGRQTFLELDGPAEVGPIEETGKNVNTDQILDMMFALRTLERTHQMFLIFLSGGVYISNQEPDPRLYTADFQAAAISGKDGVVDYWLYHLPPAPSDDKSILEIKEYFRAIFTAFATGESIDLDY